VRFREHFDKVSRGEELLRRFSLINRAVEAKKKRLNQNKKVNKDGVATTTPSIVDTKI